MLRIHILAIGLNVGKREPAHQLGAALAQTQSAFGPPLAVGMTQGEWEGVAERTLQVAVLCTDSAIARRAPALAQGLQQDAIAVTVQGAGSWNLWHAAGYVSAGGSIAEFPIVLDLPSEE